MKAYEWTRQHFPNLMDCRPIYVRRAVEATGFEITYVATEHMWVPVEFVLAARRKHSFKPPGKRPRASTHGELRPESIIPRQDLQSTFRRSLRDL